MVVTGEDIRRANKTILDQWFNSTVQCREEDVGSYMGTLELFHQVHCLDMLRRAVHRDYYVALGRHSHVSDTHLDHWVEITRQTLMCNPDLDLITFHWVEGNPVGYPDSTIGVRVRTLRRP